jgi:hypothetical protein
MKGRGVRVISETEMEQVNPGVKRKSRFVIVDAVGVCERDMTDSRPLEKKRNVTFDKLLDAIALGNREPEALESLAGRLVRLEKRFDQALAGEVRQTAKGQTLSEIALTILASTNPDSVEGKAKEGKDPYFQPTDKDLESAQAKLMQEAVAPLANNPVLRQLLIKIHQTSEQVIDVISRDRVLFAGASQQTTQNAEDTTRSFRDYIEKHEAEITALQLLYSRPYRHRLTEPMLKELEKKLREEHAGWTEDRLWDAFASVAPKKVKGRSQAGRFADLVALVRFALEREQVLQPFTETVNQRFIEWIERNISKDILFTLMSVHSISKPNPSKERTLALQISRQRNIPDFLIPLKVDNAELDWLTTDISYVAFDHGWADGLRHLLKKLDSIAAPKLLTDGAALAASTFSIGDDLCSAKTEQVRANVIRLQTLPDVLTGFEIPTPLTEEQGSRLSTNWPYYRIGKSVAVAFCPPSQEYEAFVKPTGEQWSWRNCEKVRGVRARDIVVNLILRTVEVMLLRAGCKLHPKRRGIFYLPANFTGDGQLHFKNFRDKRTWLRIRGKATFWRPGKPSEINFHHFAMQVKLGRGLDASFWIQVTPSLFFFDEAGNPIVDNRVGPRRRRVTKDWWNGKWINRLLAAEQILANVSSNAEFGIVLEKTVLALSSPITLNEEMLEDARKAEEKENPDIEDDVVRLEGEDYSGNEPDE